MQGTTILTRALRGVLRGVVECCWTPWGAPHGTEILHLRCFWLGVFNDTIVEITAVSLGDRPLMKELELVIPVWLSRPTDPLDPLPLRRSVFVETAVGGIAPKLFAFAPLKVFPLVLRVLFPVVLLVGGTERGS